MTDQPTNNWQQDFRDLMFGDLKVIKFILDNDPRSYGETFVPVPMWADILHAFFEANYRAMTTRERNKFLQQVEQLTNRITKANKTISEMQAS
jgi:hypothetical protein